MNACAAKKGNNRILLLQKGEECQDIVDTCELMVNLIDTLDPYATIYTQSTYTFSITSSTAGNTFAMSINGVTIGTTLTFSGTEATDAASVATMINTDDTYSAYSDGTSVIISGKDGSASNGYILAFTTNATLNTPSPLTLLGGEDYLSRNTETCLTLPQINNMLQYLCKLCDSNCNTNLN